VTWLRVVTGALLAVFALPSCITSNLWRSRYQPSPRTVATRVHVRDSAEPGANDAAVAVYVRPLGATIAQLCNPPRQEPVQWLLLRPHEYADSVRTLLATGQDLRVQILRDASDGRPPVPRCRLYCLFGTTPPKDPRLRSLPGTYRSIFLLQPYRYFVDDCDVELLDAPTTSTDASEVLLEFLDGPNGTLECVLATPVTVALDAVLLPLELLVMAGG
jgi:hypothetical protein